jgi:CP family cyanate transporter-like MFS transporter
MFRKYGASQTKAGLILACFTIAFLCGNPVFGSLSKSHDRRRWLAASAILPSAGLIALAIVPNLAPFIWIAVSGFGLGGAFTLGMTLPLDNTHSVEQANVWSAFVMTVGYLFAAGGPLMLGVTRDLTGSFRLPVWLLVVASVAMLTLTPLLQPSCDEL